MCVCVCVYCRLFFYVMPGTHTDLLEPAIRAIMHVKAFELVKVRNWYSAY